MMEELTQDTKLIWFTKVRVIDTYDQDVFSIVHGGQSEHGLTSWAT